MARASDGMERRHALRASISSIALGRAARRSGPIV